MFDLETVMKPATPAEILNEKLSAMASSKKSDSMEGIQVYEFQKTIGEGNFAKVKLATHKITNEKVAIKVIEKSKLDEASSKKLYREVGIMQRLNHPHIVRLYEVIDTPAEMYLVMEYASGGEVFDYLVTHGRMKEKEARKYFRQILSAVNYCHSLGIIHRDLKAENLLFDSQMNIKIADFGFSNYFSPDKLLTTWCGSPPYAAPELFQGRSYTGPEVDVWSLGVVLYVLVCGALPFDGDTLQKLRARVLSGKFHIPFYMSHECENLIRRCLVMTPVRRARLDDLTKDRWVNDGYIDVIVPGIDVQISYNASQVQQILSTMTSLGFNAQEVLQSFQKGCNDQRAASFYLVADKLYQRKPIENNLISSDTTDSRVTTPFGGASQELHSASTGVVNRMDVDVSYYPSSRPPFAVDGHMHHTLPMEIAEQPEPQQVREQQVPLQSSSGSSSPSPDFLAETASMAATSNNRWKNTSREPKMPPAKPKIQTNQLPTTVAPSPKSANPRMETTLTTNLEADPLRPRSHTFTTHEKTENGESHSFKNWLGISTTHTGHEAEKPRTVRFTFSVATTSTKSPEWIMQELYRVSSSFEGMQSERQSNFIIRCFWHDISFDIELCKVAVLNIHGIRFKRVAGHSWTYKRICADFLSKLNL